MRALASHSTVLTPRTDKQHLLISHNYFLHPEKEIKKRTVRPRDTDEVEKCISYGEIDYPNLFQ